MSGEIEHLFSFGDANVTSIERDILGSPTAWLNDACIAFWFECVHFAPHSLIPDPSFLILTFLDFKTHFDSISDTMDPKFRISTEEQRKFQKFCL